MIISLSDLPNTPTRGVANRKSGIPEIKLLKVLKLFALKTQAHKDMAEITTPIGGVANRIFYHSRARHCKLVFNWQIGWICQHRAGKPSII